MNRNLPSRAQSLLCRETRIVQPTLIEKLCRAVWTSGPCQRRDGVDYQANVLYISRFFEAVPQGCHARIIEPYGGPIGPKLRCSCPAPDAAGCPEDSSGPGYARDRNESRHGSELCAFRRDDLDCSHRPDPDLREV